MLQFSQNCTREVWGVIWTSPHLRKTAEDVDIFKLQKGKMIADCWIQRESGQLVYHELDQSFYDVDLIFNFDGEDIRSLI